MTLKGNTADFPLDVVIRLLADTKKTGELALRGEGGEGALGVAMGRVVTAVFGDESPIPALGAIFRMGVAEFEFTPWNDAPEANLEGDLEENLRKAEEHRQWLASVREVIPDDRARFRLSERAAEQGAVTFTSDRWRVVLAVNGERDVNGISQHLRIDRDATLNLLAGLVRDGVIETVAAPEQGAPPAPSPPPEAPLPVVAEPEPPAPSPVAEPEPPAPSPVAAPEPPAPVFTEPEPAAPVFTEPEPAAAVFEAEPVAEAPAPAAESATDRSAPVADWTMTPPPPQDWSAPPPEPLPPPPMPQEWGLPAAAEPAPEEPAPSVDDRLAALFGPPPAATTDTGGAAGTDPWGAPAPAPVAWTTPAPATVWSAPAPAEPAAPLADDPRLGALLAPPPMPTAPEVPAPPVMPANEWAPPADTQVAPASQKKGIFGRFKREESAPEPATSTTLVDRSASTRIGLLAAFSNALLTEYNSGHYGKGRVDDRMPGLLMRVDEQADPIDRPLPVVDDRLDVQVLERVSVAETQAVPYLALLVSTIYGDAEKAFGRDKAKRGYKAAMQHVFGGDTSALGGPDLAGKLPKV